MEYVLMFIGMYIAIWLAGVVNSFFMYDNEHEQLKDHIIYTFKNKELLFWYSAIILFMTICSFIVVVTLPLVW